MPPGSPETRAAAPERVSATPAPRAPEATPPGPSHPLTRARPPITAPPPAASTSGWSTAESRPRPRLRDVRGLRRCRRNGGRVFVVVGGGEGARSTGDQGTGDTGPERADRRRRRPAPAANPSPPIRARRPARPRTPTRRRPARRPATPTSWRPTPTAEPMPHRRRKGCRPSSSTVTRPPPPNRPVTQANPGQQTRPGFGLRPPLGTRFGRRSRHRHADLRGGLDSLDRQHPDRHLRSDSEPGPSSAGPPTTPTKPDDVDTTDCAHNALDALAERHRSPIGPVRRRRQGRRTSTGRGAVRGHRDHARSAPAPGHRPGGTPDDGATDAYDAISDRLTELGDGSTALVTSNWTSGTYTGGHTYLAHNDGGDITFADPTSGETHPAADLQRRGRRGRRIREPRRHSRSRNSTSENVSSTIGDVDANKEPATYTDWESADRSDAPDLDSPTHSHPDGAISAGGPHPNRDPAQRETVTIEERRTVYEPGHPPGRTPPATATRHRHHHVGIRGRQSGRAQHRHLDRARHPHRRGRIQSAPFVRGNGAHQRGDVTPEDVSGGVAEGTNQYGAIRATMPARGRAPLPARPGACTTSSRRTVTSTPAPTRRWKMSGRARQRRTHCRGRVNLTSTTQLTGRVKLQLNSANRFRR